MMSIYASTRKVIKSVMSMKVNGFFNTNILLERVYKSCN